MGRNTKSSQVAEPYWEMWGKIEGYFCGKVQLSLISLAEKYFMLTLLNLLFVEKKSERNTSFSLFYPNKLYKKNEVYVWMAAR